MAMIAAFIAPAFGNALIFQSIAKRRGNLHQRRFEINTSTRNADRFLLASGFVIARSKTGPTAKALGRTELSHIHTNLRNDRDCGAMVNAGNRAKERNSPIILLNHSIDTDIHPLNQLLNIVEMVTDDTNAILLLRRNLIALNRSQNIICLFLERALQE